MEGLSQTHHEVTEDKLLTTILAKAEGVATCGWKRQAGGQSEHGRSQKGFEKTSGIHPGSL